MSGVPSTPSTPGRDSASRAGPAASFRLAMAIGVVAHAEGATGRVVGGDDEQPAVVTEERRRRRVLPRLSAMRPGRGLGSR